jgi:galactose mutarotase-like enzyme
MAATMEIEEVQTNRELLEDGREGVEKVKNVAEKIAKDAEDMHAKALDAVAETTELSKAMTEVSQTAEKLKKQAQAVVQAAEQYQQSVKESIQGAEEQVERVQEEQTMSEERQQDAKHDLISRSLITVRYTLTENNALQIDYTVDSGEEARLNVDTSMYFNLAGAGMEHLGEHELFVQGDDEGMRPFSEEHYGVGNPATYGQAAPTGIDPTGMEAEQKDEQEIRQVSGGMIETWEVSPNEDGTPALAARVLELETGRVVEILTTAHSLAFHTGTFMGGDRKSQETMPEPEATPMAQPEQQVGAAGEQQRALQPWFDPRYAGFYVSIQQFPEALEAEETPEEMAADPEESPAESGTGWAYSYTIVYKFYAM